MNDMTIIQERMHQWLGDITPAWGSISPEIRSSFMNAPTLEEGPTVLNEHLSKEELSSSLVLQHAQLVLKAINACGGTPTTQQGNLTRNFVSEMLAAFDWPDYEAEQVRKYCKVVNENDFLPLHFIHLLLRSTKLLKKLNNKITITKSGIDLLDESKSGKLQAVLFKALVNNFNIEYFDRIKLHGIIQPQFGLVLYLINNVADNWVKSDKLMKLTVIPVTQLLMSNNDCPQFAFELRVIRYLAWFGLMERRLLVEKNVYLKIIETRKSELFYKFILYKI